MNPSPYWPLTLLFLAVAAHGGENPVTDLDERFTAPPTPIPEVVEKLAGEDFQVDPTPRDLSSVAAPQVGRTASNQSTRPSPAPSPQAGLPFAIETVVEPNAEGVVLLRYGLRADPPAFENVFDRRQAVPSGQALALRLGGISLGSRPVAMINGRVVMPGQRIEGFNLVFLDRTAAFLEKNGRVLRLPLHLAVRITEEGAK